MRKINHIIIHCSASKNGDASITRAVINDWHNARGWNGIGYHYVIECDGSVKRGREDEQVGAHVQNHNNDSIGVVMVGTDRFYERQWGALAELITALRGKYPDADVHGHRDFSPDTDGDGVIERHEWLKTCPGFDVAEWLAGGMMPNPANVI